MSTNPEKLPLFKIILFAIGQFGWSIAAFAPANLLTFFYLPPEKDVPLFPPYLFQGALFFGLTIIGLINFGGRFFDAITDPIIANLSDRNKSPLGRRKIFLLFSSLPVAIFSFLMFFPFHSSISVLNIITLTIAIILYYLAITAYCTPYYALIAELGHTTEERLNISTAISITWALGFIVGNLVYALIPVFRTQFNINSTSAFQLTLALFSVISFIAMIVPVIFIDEKKYTEGKLSDEGLFISLKSAFSDMNFVRFTISDLTYWISLTFLQIGISYFVVTLLKLDESMPTVLMTILFLLSFFFYVPINIFAKKFGKKPIMIFAFSFLALVFLTASLLGLLPIPPLAQGLLLVVTASMPLAVFGIIPNAIVADIADADGISTGSFKAGIFYAARTFMMKLGISIANLLFPSLLLLLLGKSVDNPFGIRLAGFTAFLFCIIGLLLFLLYNEKKILLVIKGSKNG